MKIDFQTLKEEEIFRTKQGKMYLKGLHLAVEAGAISGMVLQKKLEIDSKTACQMVNWMVEHGFVKDDAGANCLKTTLMTEDEFEELRQTLGYSLKTKREKQRTVDESLYKASLRLAIRRNTINESMLKDAFAIGSIKASAVMAKMREDGYIGMVKGVRREILITKEKFEELYGE